MWHPRPDQLAGNPGGLAHWEHSDQVGARAGLRLGLDVSHRDGFLEDVPRSPELDEGFGAEQVAPASNLLVGGSDLVPGREDGCVDGAVPVDLGLNGVAVRTVRAQGRHELVVVAVGCRHFGADVDPGLLGSVHRGLSAPLENLRIRIDHR